MDIEVGKEYEYLGQPVKVLEVYETEALVVTRFAEQVTVNLDLLHPW